MNDPAVHSWSQLKTNQPFFIFEILNVPWKLEIAKTVTVNYTVENTLLPRI